MNALRPSNKGVGGIEPLSCLSSRGALLGQTGAIAIKTLFWTVFIIAALYGAYKFAPPYVSFYMLKTDVEEEAKLGHMYNDEALEKRILQMANSWSVPLDKDDIDITRNAGFITISVHYTDTIDLPGDYDVKIERRIVEEERLRDASGVLQ